MEVNEDSGKEERKYSAIRFCLEATLILFVIAICTTLYVLFIDHWDSQSISTKPMLIFYMVVVFMMGGAFSVATMGWQEKD